MADAPVRKILLYKPLTFHFLIYKYSFIILRFGMSHRRDRYQR